LKPAILSKRDLVFVISSDLGEVLLGEGAELAVINSSSSSQHHPRALVVGADVVGQVIPRIQVEL